MRFYRPFSPVRAFTFDLDDTLYNNGPYIRHADAVLKAYIAEHFEHASKLSPQDWFAIRKEVITKTPTYAYDMGKLRMAVLRVALKQDVQGEDNETAAKACFDCFYHARSDFTLDQNTHDVLQRLSDSAPLLGITNGNVDCDQIGIRKYFVDVYHASTTRPSKPHRAMFDEAVNALSLPAQQILHVGDCLKNDVYGAVNAGYQAAWYAFNRPMALTNERVKVLPHVALDNLNELTSLINNTY